MMKRLFFNPISLTSLITLLLIGAWLVFLPTQLASQLKYLIEQRTGRTFEIGGGISLSFAPTFSLVLHDIKLAGSSALAEPVVTAKTMSVPLSVKSLLGRIGDINVTTISDADVTVAINAQGHANVWIDQNPDASKTDIDAPGTDTVAVKIQSGALHYSDARDGSEFILPQISGDFAFGAHGDLVASGSAEINGRHAIFSTTLKSLVRVFDEGSPLDFNLESEGHAFLFSGRITTRTALNLAGQGAVETSDTQKLFKWLGVDLKAMPAGQSFSVSGAFESQGPNFIFKKSQLHFAKQQMTGDIAFSMTGKRPSVVTKLDFDTLHFDGATASETWSEIPLDFSLFKNIDAQFQISVAKLSYGPTQVGLAKIDGSIKDGMLSGKFTGDSVSAGQINIDANQASPALDLKITMAQADAKAILAVLAGQSWLNGVMTLSANLKAHGVSQAELISTLNGNIDAGLENGSLLGVDLKNLVGLQQGWNGGTTDFTKASVRFNILDGIASFQENHLAGQGLSVTAAGEIDVLRHNLAMSFEPVAKQKILLDGPWDNPKISAISGTLH